MEYRMLTEQRSPEAKAIRREMARKGIDYSPRRITVDDYDKYVMKYKSEMEDLDRKLVEYTNNDKSFNITSAYLLQLASKAKGIFESSQPEQKNKILRMLLANPTLNEKRLQLPLLKPFSVLIDTLESSNWLALADTLRTESLEYDDHKLGMIKEVLHSL